MLVLRIIFAGIAIVFSSLSGAVGAAVVTWDISFKTSNLRDVMSGLPVDTPYAPVVGSLSVTFDNEVTVADETSGITLHAINLPMGSPLAFTYDAQFHYILIGGSEYGVNGMGLGADDFYLALSGLSGTDPIGEYFLFVPWTDTDHFPLYTQDQDLDVTITETAVPEPASWAMMIGGFSLLGGAMRRRTNTANFA
jgi:hypothetical protein